MTTGICLWRTEHLKEWLYEYVIRPHQEGIERLKRAWSGINAHCIYQPKLSLKERLISLISGVFLTFLPFFNFVIWKGWEAFGNPEVLSPHFPLEMAVSPRKTAPVEMEGEELVLVPEIQPLLPLHQTQGNIRIETFKHIETEGRKPSIHCDGTIQYLSDHILITKESRVEKVKCRYSLDWKLLEYNLVTSDGIHFHVLHEKGALNLHAQKEGRQIKKIHPLKGNLAWIQQPILALKEFVRSGAPQIEFCAIDPSDLSLAEFTGKRKQVVVNGLVKIEFSISGLKSFFWKGIGWADPKTGEMKKLVSDASPFKPILTISASS